MKRPSVSNVKETINLGIVINSHKEVLLIKRAKKEGGKDKSILSWAFPGGRLHKNESKKECVEREILEETGYKVESIKEISSRIHPQFPVFIVYHLCKLLSEEPIAKPKNPHEIAEIRWVEPKEMKKLFTTDLDSKVGHELGLS
ncbi:MAG: NUDIX hydrolase [Candidatus Nealsonbacteria bacterium]|nr:NUDIX hydrolase [Candidatus Nealsonbacteria bacterium]